MEGHTGLPVQVFGQNLAEALKTALPDDLDLDGDLECDADFVQRSRTAKAERTVAACIRTMTTGARDPLAAISTRTDCQMTKFKPLTPSAISRSLSSLEAQASAKLIQSERLLKDVRETLRCARRLVRRLNELKNSPDAPRRRSTGSSASISSDDPKTRIRAGFRFHHRRDSPLSADIVIVDEASYGRHSADGRPLRCAERWRAADSGRRPVPVAGGRPGAVLRDLVGCANGEDRVGPGHFELTELKRQDPSLLIARNCKSISYESRVITDNRSASDFFFLPMSGARANCG